MRINHSMVNLNAYTKISANSANVVKDLERLSSKDIRRTDLNTTPASDTAAGSAIQVSISKEGQALNNASATPVATTVEAASSKIKSVDSANEAINAKNSTQNIQRSKLQTSVGTNRIQQKADQAKIDSPEKAAIAMKSISDMVIKQSSNAMLSQSNQTPQSVLQLLK